RSTPQGGTRNTRCKTKCPPNKESKPPDSAPTNHDHHEGLTSNSNIHAAKDHATVCATNAASKPANAPVISNSNRRDRVSCIWLAPNARSKAASATRSSRVANKAASNTNKPALRVNKNNNCKASIT